MYRRCLILLLSLAYFPLSFSEDVSAEGDSKIISAYVLENYADMFADYVTVFVGHIQCHYTFIDETIFNDLADDAIRDVTEKAAKVLIGSSSVNLERMTKSEINYLASMLAMTVIDVHTTVLSEKLTNNFTSGEFSCEKIKTSHQQLYQQLIKRHY